jgi:hypothetical protein
MMGRGVLFHSLQAIPVLNNARALGSVNIKDIC